MSIRFPILLSLLVAACNAPDDPRRYTFEYYQANSKARDAKIQRCTQDGGFTRADQTCINARAALQAEGIGSFKDLPPMGLVPEQDSGKSNER